MRQITEAEELRTIQKNILDNIVEFCDKNHIQYSLAGGTLIGALRHKGYIPWDDDIDLYMMRKEYERFATLYKDENGVYELLTPGCGKEYLYTFGKVIDNRTLMIEEGVEGFQLGVNVDIFAIDYVKDDMKTRNRQFYMKRLLLKIRRCKMSKTNYLHSKLAFYCYKYLFIPLSSINWLLNHYVFFGKPSQYVCDMHNAGIDPSMAFSSKAFSDTVKVEFEGKRYDALTGYDEYLTKTYGNYMQMPPIEQRYHHHFKAFWK